MEPRVGYGGCCSLVWGSKGDDIYIDYLSSLLYLQLVATKETPAGRRGWGLGKGEGDGDNTSLRCRVGCDGGRALFEDVCRLAVYQLH